MKWIKLTYKVENWVSGTDDSVFLDVNVVIIFTGTNIKFCAQKKLYSDKDLLNWRRKTEFVGEKTPLW